MISTKELVKAVEGTTASIITSEFSEISISDIKDPDWEVVKVETQSGNIYHFRMVEDDGLFEVEHPTSREFIKVTLIGSMKVGERIETNHFMTSPVKSISKIFVRMLGS
ncbi:MAG: hypothetical protein KJI69_00670 [Patescibacteria group bacterium]|nr:hypothetical protein [Patescibacteria group bacterium]